MGVGEKTKGEARSWQTFVTTSDSHRNVIANSLRAFESLSLFERCGQRRCSVILEPPPCSAILCFPFSCRSSMSRSAAMTRRLLPSCRRLAHALPASSSRSIPITSHPPRLSPLVHLLDCPAALLSTKNPSFESKQSRLSAPLPPLSAPAPESSAPSSSSKPASLALSSPAPVSPSTAYRRPTVAVVENGRTLTTKQRRTVSAERSHTTCLPSTDYCMIADCGLY